LPPAIIATLGGGLNQAEPSKRQDERPQYDQGNAVRGDRNDELAGLVIVPRSGPMSQAKTIASTPPCL
jgi:hypothetical protein